MKKKRFNTNPNMEKIGVGHLLQSIEAQRKLLENMQARLDKTETFAKYLAEQGQLEAPQVKIDRTKEYFVRCIEATKFNRKPLETYEQFREFTSTTGTMELFLSNVEKWVGKKLTYPECDELALECLPSKKESD